jgi:hypothetical protein
MMNEKRRVPVNEKGRRKKNETRNNIGVGYEDEVGHAGCHGFFAQHH